MNTTQLIIRTLLVRVSYAYDTTNFFDFLHEHPALVTVKVNSFDGCRPEHHRDVICKNSTSCYPVIQTDVSSPTCASVYSGKCYDVIDSFMQHRIGQCIRADESGSNIYCQVFSVYDECINTEGRCAWSQQCLTTESYCHNEDECGMTGLCTFTGGHCRVRISQRNLWRFGTISLILLALSLLFFPAGWVVSKDYAVFQYIESCMSGFLFTTSIEDLLCTAHIAAIRVAQKSGDSWADSYSIPTMVFILSVLFHSTMSTLQKNVEGNEESSHVPNLSHEEIIHLPVTIDHSMRDDMSLFEQVSQTVASDSFATKEPRRDKTLVGLLPDVQQYEHAMVVHRTIYRANIPSFGRSLSGVFGVVWFIYFGSLLGLCWGLQRVQDAWLPFIFVLFYYTSVSYQLGVQYKKRTDTVLITIVCGLHILLVPASTFSGGVLPYLIGDEGVSCLHSFTAGGIFTMALRHCFNLPEIIQNAYTISRAKHSRSLLNGMNDYSIMDVFSFDHSADTDMATNSIVDADESMDRYNFYSTDDLVDCEKKKKFNFVYRMRVPAMSRNLISNMTSRFSMDLTQYYYPPQSLSHGDSGQYDRPDRYRALTAVLNNDTGHIVTNIFRFKLVRISVHYGLMVMGAMLYAFTVQVYVNG